MHATTVVVRPGVVPQRFCQKARAGAAAAGRDRRGARAAKGFRFSLRPLSRAASRSPSPLPPDAGAPRRVQCTTPHALEAFDAALRSCRKSLDRHKEQRRQKRARQTAAAGSAAAASPRAKGGTAAGVGSGPSAEPVGEDGAVVLAMMSAKPE